MEQKILDLYDEYVHTLLPRRDFLKRLTKLAGGTAAAFTILPLLEGTGAEAALIAEDDSQLTAGSITYPGATGDVKAYMARPKGSAKLPGVVVIHENKGLSKHIEDVARRVALEGFNAIAPDLLSPLGGTPADRNKARDMIYDLDSNDVIKNLNAAVSYLKNLSGSTGKVGCMGFCWGGQRSNLLSIHGTDLSAAVVYYGRSPATKDVPKIRVPLLLHYAGKDKRINKGMPAYEAALKKAGKQYTMHMYEGANHAFNNDVRPARYDKTSAQLAWKRTISFLNKTLKG